MDWRCVLIIGRSGSGKSTLAGKLAARQKKVVVVNSPVDESISSALGGKTPITSVPWENIPLANEKGVAYIIDDVQGLKKRNQEKLFTLFNVTARHNDCSCVVICHSLLNTGLFSVVNFTTEIILSHDKTNTKTLRLLLKDGLYSDEDKKAAEMAFANLREFEFIVLRPNERTWMTVDADLKEIVPATRRDASESSPEENNAANEDEVMQFLQFVATPRTKRLAEFLLRNLPERSVRLPDLHLRAKSNNGETIEVSFLDYILTLDSEDCTPEASITKLHKLLLKKMCYPRQLITNKTLKKLEVKK